MRNRVTHFFCTFVRYKRCLAVVDAGTWRNDAFEAARLNGCTRSVGQSFCFARRAFDREAVSVFKWCDPHRCGYSFTRFTERDERNVFGVVDLGIGGCHRRECRNRYCCTTLSGRGDLNPRPPGPKPGTLPTAPLPGLG